MSVKKIEQVKSSKWFKLFDLIIYGLLVATVIALIIVVTVGRDKSTLSGFCVYRGNDVILTYEFGDKLPENNGYITVEESGEDGFYLHYKDGAAYNDIFVNTKEKSVKITASNCSVHKDCVYTPALKTNGSVPIICTVHNLTIVSSKFVDDGTVVI